MSIVILYVDTNQERISSERRFDKSLTIDQLKYKLETIVGVPYATQKLDLYRGDLLLGPMDDDTRMLGSYPVEDYMRIQVTDTNPHHVRNQYTDVSLVEKFEITDEQYQQKSDTVRAFKERNRLGRFSDEAAKREEQVLESYEEALKNIKVGDRCRVITDETEVSKLGTVRFIGTTSFQAGPWVGVQYDEPLGKNDGSVKGERYFECPKKYGGFVRPTKVEVGDFPEEDLFDDDLEEM
ncbi:CAP Gly-rich domain-containing protein [Pilobolus umbonatus]|nr:CAP Gly-rich domain-containing protein [Pilobolus umbonatus]